MKILLLLANASVEEYFKKQKQSLDECLEDNVYFHSLAYNCLDEEVFKCVQNMKPDLIIYRSGSKENKETTAFLKEIRTIRPACNIFVLAENMSLIFTESLYDIGIYDLFIGKQIEIVKIVEAIKTYWKSIEVKKAQNKAKIEVISNDIQYVSKEKNNYSFIIAENLLPEGSIQAGKRKRVSLMYYNLTPKKEVFNMRFTIDYFDETGIEKSKSFEAFMDNPKKVIDDLSAFNYQEEEFFEDKRFLYSSYDIIFNDFKVHGNMNWEGLFKELSEYTLFDKMKTLEISDMPYNIPYKEFVNFINMKNPEVLTDVETEVIPKKKFSIFKKKKEV